MSASLGLYLPTYGPDVSWQTIRDVTVEAERLGWDGVFVCDHILDGRLIESQRNAPPDIFECWTTLSALAGVTTQIQLGTSVLAAPLRWPGVHAKACATLDNISAGRLIVGLGTGWGKAEFEKHGVPYEPFKTRFERMKESLQIMKGIWLEPGFRHEGTHYQLNEAECHPPVVAPDGPPIWLGGVGKMALQLIGEAADGWLPVFVPPAGIESGLKSLDHHLDAHGRTRKDLTIGYLTFASVDPDGNTARANAEPFMRDLSAHQVDGNRPMDVSAVTVVGSVEEAAQMFQNYIDVGVDYLVFGIAPMEYRHYMRNLETLKEALALTAS